MCPTPVPQAYTFNAPAGVPGGITRVDQTNVEPAMLKVQPVAFGLAMKYVSGGISPFVGGETAANFAGVNVREVPQISGDDSQGLFDAIPNINEPNGMAVRGYATVICQFGTPVRGAGVYVRIAATSGSRIQGGFEATADGGNNVLLSDTQADWASDGMDASNIAELRIAR